MHVQPEVHLHQVRKKNTAHCKALAVIHEVCQNRVLWSAWVAAAKQGLKAVAKLSFSGELWVHCTNDTAVCVHGGGGGCVCASCVERGSRIKRKRFLKVSNSASELAAPLAHLSFLKMPRFSNWLCFFSCNGTHRSMTKPLQSVGAPTQTQTRRYTYIPSLPNHLCWPHTGSAIAAHTA